MHEQPTCACGCGATVGQGKTFVRGHNGRRSAVDYTEDPVTGCWVWMGSVWKSNGYARLKRGGKWVQAYRVYYEQACGPIAAGLTIDHLCRNRLCVNPAHLEPVTLRENQRRAGLIKLTDSQRAAVGASTGLLRLTAEQFGISVGHVSVIRKQHRTHHETHHAEGEK